MDSEFDISRIAKSDFNMDSVCFQEYKKQFSIHGNNGNNGDRECKVACKLTGILPWSLENRKLHADRDPDGQDQAQNGCDEIVNLAEYVKWELKRSMWKVNHCENVIGWQNKEIKELKNKIKELTKAADLVEVEHD